MADPLKLGNKSSDSIKGWDCLTVCKRDCLPLSYKATDKTETGR